VGRRPRRRMDARTGRRLVRRRPAVDPEIHRSTPASGDGGGGVPAPPRAQHGVLVRRERRPRRAVRLSVRDG
jgi:hypothetical protein